MALSYSNTPFRVLLCGYEYVLCMYECMYVCMYVCMYEFYVCMTVCVYVYSDACMYACMYVCMYVCVYVCTYVCMSVTAADQSPPACRMAPDGAIVVAGGRRRTTVSVPAMAPFVRAGVFFPS